MHIAIYCCTVTSVSEIKVNIWYKVKLMEDSLKHRTIGFKAIKLLAVRQISLIWYLNSYIDITVLYFLLLSYLLANESKFFSDWFDEYVYVNLLDTSCIRNRNVT